jgi:hypothetical protein
MSSLVPVPTGIQDALDGGQRVDARELGVIGGYIFRNFITGETINVMPVSYAELRRITDQDGQAKGLLRMLTMPIINAKWDVLSSDEDSMVATGKSKSTQDVVGTQSSKERDLIAENLFSTFPEGGMSTPFEDILAVLALAIRDGFKVFEKVFALNQQGRVILQKLAYRDNDTVTLLSDDHGDYAGFRQRVHFSGRYIDVTLGAEKSLIYTFGKEDSPLYGNPLFLPVYYHTDKKHKLYYISHIAYQQLALPARVGKAPAGTPDPVREKFLSDLASLGFNAAMTVPVGFEVDPFESKRSLADFIPLIDHHNAMSSKAVLGQFMDLSRSATGRLAGEQQDIFVMGIQQVLKSIEKLWNNWVIPQLVDFNFGTRSYPKLRARAFTDSDQEMLSEVFKEVMTSGANHASPEFLLAVEEKMAGQLEMRQLDYDKIASLQIERELEQRAILEAAHKVGGGNTNTDPTQGPSGKSKGDGSGKEGNG